MECKGEDKGMETMDRAKLPILKGKIGLIKSTNNNERTAIMHVLEVVNTCVEILHQLCKGIMM